MFHPLLIWYCYRQPNSAIFFQKDPNHDYIPKSSLLHFSIHYPINHKVGKGAEWLKHTLTLPCFRWALFHLKNRRGLEKLSKCLSKEQNSRNWTQGILRKTIFPARNTSRAFLPVRHCVLDIQGHHPGHRKKPKPSCCREAMTAIKVYKQQCHGFYISPSFLYCILLQNYQAASTTHHWSGRGEQKHVYSSKRLRMNIKLPLQIAKRCLFSG